MFETRKTLEQRRKERKAILVGGILPENKRPSWGNSPLAELRFLAKTAGIETKREVIQHLNTINSTCYIGRGKAKEVADCAAELGANMVIFDNDLSPSQLRNLEKIIDLPIMDRTELILEIFATHAQTKQAKLQVELAQLEYTLPRLKRMWSHLSRIDGGLGVKGPGEKQLEMDRRLIHKKISDLRNTLKGIQKRKEREVSSRQQLFTVSLVGYTNAGKSTLMNAVTEAEVLVEDKLFATLDTRTRTWDLTPSKKVLLSDTVGFISKIPPHLIASFHATLEEVNQSDLLLHVVDLSHWSPQQHIDEVNDVLKSLGCDEKKILMVFNKVDLLSDPVELNLLKRRFPNHVTISAQEGEGLEELRQKVFEFATEDDEEMEVITHVSNGKLLAFASEHTTVLEKEFNGEEARLKLRVEPRFKGRLEELMECPPQ